MLFGLDIVDERGRRYFTCVKKRDAENGIYGNSEVTCFHFIALLYFIILI